jgi:hypothetical protein
MTERYAILLPGAGYTSAHPLLHFTRAVLEVHGWTVVEASWPADEASRRNADQMVSTIAAELIDSLGNPQPLIVGKSIGSLAIPLAAERGLSGIWFTPLLRRPAVADALERLPDPTLLIGSTGDETWDGDAARRSKHQVVELTDANHGLERVDDPLGSIDGLRTVIGAVDGFAAELDGAGDCQ